MVAQMSISSREIWERRIANTVATLLFCGLIYGAVYSVQTYRRSQHRQQEVWARLDLARDYRKHDNLGKNLSENTNFTNAYLGLSDGGEANRKDKKEILTIENSLFIDATVQEDFRSKQTKTDLLRRMKQLGLRILRYTNGKQEWRFNVPN